MSHFILETSSILLSKTYGRVTNFTRKNSRNVWTDLGLMKMFVWTWLLLVSIHGINNMSVVCSSTCKMVPQLRTYHNWKGFTETNILQWNENILLKEKIMFNIKFNFNHFFKVHCMHFFFNYNNNVKPV